MLEILLQDLRYGIRILLKQPIFTVAAVITLALGIGANTVVFSIVDAVLLRPLPFKDPDRLIMLWEVDGKQEKEGRASSTGNFGDWENQSKSFEGMAAYFKWTYNLTGLDEPERINSAVVTGKLFQVLGVNAKLGRVLNPEDDQSGRDAVAVLSHGLWKRRFGQDPAIIGREVKLNGVSFTVVGVMPQDFQFPDEEAEIWVPAGFSAKQLQDRRGKFISVIARLKPGIDLEQAQTEMRTISSRLEQQYPETNTGWGVKLERLDSVRVLNIRSALFVLLGAVGFVLLISCANVANLLLARAAARRREFAIRIALGASRMRLTRQLLTESFLLAMLGGLIGILLASWGVSLIALFNPGDIPRLDETEINGRVLCFTLAVSAISVMLFGLAPVLFASRANPQESLRAEGRSTADGSKRKFRDALVISEIAVALVLLIGAGLMIKSFIRLQSVAPGFNPDNLLTMRIWLPASRYGENNRQIAFFQQVIDRIGTVPGVRRAGAIQDLPLNGNRMGFNFVIEGRPLSSAGEPNAAYRVVTVDYFAAMGIPLIRGRQFTGEDDQDATPVVVINESMRQQFWRDEDPIGKRIRFGGEDAPWYSIVGVVGDVKHMGLDADEGPAIYQPHAQKPEFLRWMTLVVRTSVEPLSMVNAVRSQVLAIDKDQPVYDVATMEQLLSKSVAKPKFYMVLLGLFATIGLLLAAIGIYGLLSFWVNQRTREIGIHIALGAKQKDVMRLVLGKGLKLALIGIMLGLAGALILTRVMYSLLYEVSTTDISTFGGISFLLMIVAILACYLPARRATKVDPMIALRCE